MAMAYLFFPEFRFLTLEEIDLIFETKGVQPVKISLKLQEAKVKQLKEERAQRRNAA